MIPIPGISVIIPAFNAEKTIAQVIESVLKQSIPLEEIILVDDGSKDKTVEICSRYPVKIIANENKSGAGNARNRGAQAAKGEIIAFLDSDVALEDDALERLIIPFKDPNIAAALGNYSHNIRGMNFASAYKQLYLYYTYEQNGGGELRNQFWTALGAVRRDVLIDCGGFREDFSGAGFEDIDLGVRLTRGGYRIKHAPGAYGRHLRIFTFLSLIANDYRKGTEDIYIHLTQKAAVNTNRHAGIRQMASAGMACGGLIFLGLSLINGVFIYVFAALFGLFIVNELKFTCLLFRRGIYFGIKGLFTNWVLYLARCASVVGGIMRVLAERAKYDRGDN